MSTAVGLERTLRIMAATPNGAAVPALAGALASREEAVRVGAAKALAARVDSESHLELLRTLAVCRPDVRAAISGDSAVVARLRKSALEGIKHGDPTLRQRICRYAIDADEHRLLPVIIEQASEHDDLAGDALATTALKLTRSLDQACQDEDLGEYSDLAVLRRSALKSLNHAMDRFGAHRRRELLEAFLLLTPANNPTLKGVLKDETHPVRRPLVAALGASAGPGAMDVLIHSLEDLNASDELLTLAAERCDRVYAARLLARFAPRPGARVIENVHRVRGFGWSRPDSRAALLEVDGPSQAAAVRLFSAAETIPSERLALAAMILRHGEDEGRLAACESLRRIQLPEVAEVLTGAMNDPSPEVVAAAASQLRRHVDRAGLVQLVGLLDHASEEVVKSAQGALKEFSLELYRGAYKNLTPEQRAIAGRLVGKADPRATDALVAELRSPAISRRVEALGSIADLEVVDRLLEPVIQAAEHEDPAIRSEAARALGRSASPTVVEPLARLLGDASPMVRDVAEASLNRLDSLERAQQLLEELQAELDGEPAEGDEPS